MKRIFLSAALLLITGGGIWWAFSKNKPPEYEYSLFDRFSEEDILSLQLETDLEKLLEDKSSVESQPAMLVANYGKADEQPFPIRVRLRGNTRKTVCNFPPLKLKFDRGMLDSLGIKPFPSLKLVTHCKSDTSFRQILFKEYLTYKIYRVLTDYAFRVQLVEIEYSDDLDSLGSEKHFGFIIENQKELAARLKGKLLSDSDAAIKTIHQEQYKLFVLFQYMIGNTDWNLTNRHNIEVIIPEGNPSPIPVPYDFDFSGFVNAPYAKPYPTMPIKSVRERLFQWRGSEDADFSEVAKIFVENRDEINALFYNFDKLDPAEREDMISYIRSFFGKLENANGKVVASYFMEQKEANPR